MSDHHFISYSTVDGYDFALKLVDDLAVGPPPFKAWLDKRELQPGDDWDDQIVEAIRDCKTLLFVMTGDAVASTSITKLEWTRALKYKKSVVPLRLQRGPELPFRLGSRQYVDFSADYDQGLARLRQYLTWIDSPEGVLRGLKDRLEDAQRDLRRAAGESEQARIQEEIGLLEQQVAEQQNMVDNPAAATEQTEKSIQRGLERERQPERPVAGKTRTKFINPPPGIAPPYFQDRYEETKLVGNFLQSPTQRIMTIVGRAGSGKTAMACRLLKSLESGRLPDDLGELKVDGIVYLSQAGSRHVDVPNLHGDLVQLLPEEKVEGVMAEYKDPKASTEKQIQTLLEAFPDGRHVLLLDNLEDLIDAESRNLTDDELNEALRALLASPVQPVKVIITTRVAPYDLALFQGQRQYRLDLDAGLPLLEAMQILRELDADKRVGLHDAQEELLKEAWQRTQGNPRALEALYAILSADRDTALAELLADAETLLPENVVHELVGEAFSRLDDTAQMVMQALAIYNRPVGATAVDFMLQPYLPAINSAPVLGRLANMQFVRKEAGRYYLHQVDRAHALSRVPLGEAADRSLGEPPFSQIALQARGAEYFAQTRLPRDEWRSIDDLRPQLAEFDMRCAAGDYDAAADVLLSIDFDYLMLWSHFRQVVELHHRLEGRVDDPLLHSASTLNLAHSYRSLGQIAMAISYYEQALAISQEFDDLEAEVAALGGLGLAHADLGQLEKAIDLTQQASSISLGSGDRYGEGVWLGNLGSYYASFGQIEMGIDYLVQALAISQEFGDRQGESYQFGNLHSAYLSLGMYDIAIEYCQQSLAIKRDIGDRYGEAWSLVDYASAIAGQGRLAEAAEKFIQARQIAREISNPETGSGACYGLALTRLLNSEIEAAGDAILEAQDYDYAPNNPDVQALLGVILLRQGVEEETWRAFEVAVVQANSLLEYSQELYRTWDARGLACCGLALCGEQRLEEARSAYLSARELCSASGVVMQVLRLFDALAEADEKGLLDDIRPVAAGEA